MYSVESPQSMALCKVSGQAGYVFFHHNLLVRDPIKIQGFHDAFELFSGQHTVATLSGKCRPGFGVRDERGKHPFRFAQSSFCLIRTFLFDVELDQGAGVEVKVQSFQ